MPLLSHGCGSRRFDHFTATVLHQANNIFLDKMPLVLKFLQLKFRVGKRMVSSANQSFTQ